MAITFNWANCSNGTNGNGNNGATAFNVGATKAQGANGSSAANNILLSMIRWEAATDPGIISVTGFNTIANCAFFNGTEFTPARCWAGWKLDTGSETFSYATSTQTAASPSASWTLISFSGVNTSSPIDVAGNSQNNSASTNMTAPSESAAAANEMMVCAWVNQGGLGPYTKPAAMTLACDVNSQGSQQAELLVAYLALVSSGATGTQVATQGSSYSSDGLTILLSPATATGIAVWPYRM